jgi:excisionase family DNA binding protein
VIQRVAGVLLDPDDAAYLCKALELLAQLLAGQRSQPTPRLQAVTTKLAKCAENGSATTVNGSRNCRVRASDADPGHHDGYAQITVAEAARLLDCGERNVRDLVRRGRLSARRTGGRWMVDAAAVELRAERKAARRKE